VVITAADGQSLTILGTGQPFRATILGTGQPFRAVASAG